MSLFDEVNRTTTSAKGETTKPNTLVSLAVPRNSFNKNVNRIVTNVILMESSPQEYDLLLAMQKKLSL